MVFEPDYRRMMDVLCSQRPERLPVYEHLISPGIMERILNSRFADPISGNAAGLRECFRQHSGFFRSLANDTVSFETCIVEVLPDRGEIHGWISRIHPDQTALGTLLVERATSTLLGDSRAADRRPPQHDPCECKTGQASTAGSQ